MNISGFSQTTEYHFPIYENPIDRPTGNPDNPFDPTSPKCIGINISPMEMYNEIHSQIDSDIQFDFELGDGINHQVLIECAEIKSGSFAEIRETPTGNYFYPSSGICEYFEGIIDNDPCQTISIMSTKDYFSANFVLNEMGYDLNQQEVIFGSDYYTTHTLCEVDWIPCFRGPNADECCDVNLIKTQCTDNKQRYLELAVNFHSSCDTDKEFKQFNEDIKEVAKFLSDNFEIELILVKTVEEEDSSIPISTNNVNGYLKNVRNKWKEGTGEFGNVSADLVIAYNCDPHGPKSILHELFHIMGVRNHVCDYCNIMHSNTSKCDITCEDDLCLGCSELNRICFGLNATDNDPSEDKENTLNCYGLPVDNCLTDPPPINEEMEITINGCDMISGCNKCDENGCLVCEGDEITLQYYQPDYIGDINWTLGTDVELISENTETHEIKVILGEGKDKHITVNFDYNGMNVNYDIPITIGGAEFPVHNVMMVNCNLVVSFPIPTGVSISNVRIVPIDENCAIVPTLVGGNGNITGALNLTLERAENIDYCPSKVVYDVETDCGTREESFDVFMIVPYCGFEPRLKPEVIELSFNPNPSNNLVSISLPYGESGNLSIFDTSGRIIFSKKNLNQNNFDLNTYSFSDGIYLVQYKTITKSYFGKISILH